jgi:hypothetical protein
MTARKFSLGLLIAGLLLVAVGALWPLLFPKDALWDDARAAQLTEASESLHTTMHAKGHEHDDESFAESDPPDDPDVQAASRRYREVQSALDTAKFWNDSAPIYLRWSGMAVCVIGVAAYFASRANQS